MDHTVPNWIERLLGIKTTAGEGAAWGIEHAWGWPPWVTLLFAVFAVIFVVALYLSQRHHGSRLQAHDGRARRQGFQAAAPSTGAGQGALRVDDDLA